MVVDALVGVNVRRIPYRHRQADQPAFASKGDAGIGIFGNFRPHQVRPAGRSLPSNLFSVGDIPPLWLPPPFPNSAGAERKFEPARNRGRAAFSRLPAGRGQLRRQPVFDQPVCAALCQQQPAVRDGAAHQARYWQGYRTATALRRARQGLGPSWSPASGSKSLVTPWPTFGWGAQKVRRDQRVVGRDLRHLPREGRKAVLLYWSNGDASQVLAARRCSTDDATSLDHRDALGLKEKLWLRRPANRDCGAKSACIKPRA